MNNCTIFWFILSHFIPSISSNTAQIYLLNSYPFTHVLRTAKLTRQYKNTLNVVIYQIPGSLKGVCHSHKSKSREYGKSWKAFNTYAGAWVSRKFVIKRFLYALFLHGKTFSSNLWKSLWNVWRHFKTFLVILVHIHQFITYVLFRSCLRGGGGTLENWPPIGEGERQ